MTEPYATDPHASVPKRAPETVMRLSRLGSLHQSRLSFMRVLTRRMAREDWTFSRPEFAIGSDGVGHALYCAHGPTHTYTLVAFAHDLPDEMRSDRVIAEAWDATFTLFDGIPTPEDIARLSQNVPLQEAGRVSEQELSLSRANRSVRLWDHVVTALASGQQPDPEQIDDVGYLMRTTAVYGSGKFGAADREKIASRPEMATPFQAEMLSVYLIRTFVRDLVQHMARLRGGSVATTLAPALAQRLGIGNSTGLGMAPFLINHPVLFNNWISAREEAISRVRSLPRASHAEIGTFLGLFSRSVTSVGLWRSQHPLQMRKLITLNRDLTQLYTYLSTEGLNGAHPWDELMGWCEYTLGEDAQELAASLMLEPYGALVDGLSDTMADDVSGVFWIDGEMTVSKVMALIEDSFGWTFGVDWSARSTQARAWYVSAEKLEPRLGERFEEPIAEYEQPLSPARDASQAFDALSQWRGRDAVGLFLLHHPEHRHTVRRAQLCASAPYGEIRDNTISADILPIDMLRAKLSFFGATHFDPRSDRWVRICMYAGAPYPEDLSDDNADLWVYPEAET